MRRVFISARMVALVVYNRLLLVMRRLKTSLFIDFCPGQNIEVSVKLVHVARRDCHIVVRDRGSSAVEYVCGIGAAERATTSLSGAFNCGLGIDEVIISFMFCPPC